MYMPGVPPWPKLAASRGRPASSVSPFARVAVSLAATRSSASSHDTGTKPGSSSRPFFGFVRFIGCSTRCGL